MKKHYSKIVFFKDVAIGEEFASSKTGHVYKKTGPKSYWWTCNDSIVPEEQIWDTDLVYGNLPVRHGCSIDTGDH